MLLTPANLPAHTFWRRFTTQKIAMNTLARSLTFALFATCLALPAQAVQSRPEPERTATTLTVSSPEGELQAALSISYGQAVWRDSHNEMLKVLEGNYTRLGIGWWTTLDTIGPIELGGVSLEAGTYYLGLAVAADSAFSLLVFDSQKVMQARMLAR